MECLELHFYDGDERMLGSLERRGSLWVGVVRGLDMEFANRRAVEKHAKAIGLSVRQETVYK